MDIFISVNKCYHFSLLFKVHVHSINSHVIQYIHLTDPYQKNLPQAIRSISVWKHPAYTFNWCKCLCVIKEGAELCTLISIKQEVFNRFKRSLSTLCVDMRA